MNKPEKDFMNANFHKWYSEQVASQVNDDKGTQPVYMQWSIIKLLSAQGLCQRLIILKKLLDISQHGFNASGITDCLKGR